MTQEFTFKELRFLEESALIEGYDFNKRPLTREIKTVKLNGEKAYLFLKNKLNETGGILFESDLLKCHEILMKDLLPHPYAGAYRDIQVYVGKHTPPKAEVVPLKMEQFLQSFNQKNKSPWEYHADFETIHPFKDGNGRIGRIIWACDLQRREIDVYSILDDFCNRWRLDDKGNYAARLDTFNECRYKYYTALGEHNSRK